MFHPRGGDKPHKLGGTNSPASRKKKAAQMDRAERRALWRYQIIKYVYENDLADLPRTEITRHIEQAYDDDELELMRAPAYQLKQRLLRSEEAGHRWVSIREVEDLAPTEAAKVYRHFLPAFDEQADEMGEKDWNTYIRRKIVKGRKVPVRQVENHVRAYVRRVVADAEGDIDSKDDIPWDQDMFEWTLARLIKPGAGEVE